MESTGVYGSPAEHSRGRWFLFDSRPCAGCEERAWKTDTADCVWLAQLLRHGLLPASFVPAASWRELRDLTRARTTFVRERASVANRIQKALEDANVKLSNVVSDILQPGHAAGFRGQKIEAARLATRSRRRMRSKQHELTTALDGKVSEHHRFLLPEYLDQVDYLERKIAVFEEEIGRPCNPFMQAIDRLDPVPGCNLVSPRALLAEIGTDRAQFPTAQQLYRWARVYPGNQESAGRRKSGRTRKGNRWLRGLLNQMAWAAHTKGTYFWAQCRRLRRH